MEPKRWLVAVALQYQHQRDNNMADCENREISRCIVGPERVEHQAAGGAMAAHLQEAAEQRAIAAAWAAAAPATPHRCPQIDGGRRYRCHAPKMSERPSGVLATVCPEAPCGARPDDAARDVLAGDGPSCRAARWPGARPARSRRPGRTAGRRWRYRPRPA